MDSRTEFDGRIHFFEYFSLEKFEESLRNALQYSIGIITQQDRFIQYFQYSKEIAYLIEFCINLPYALKYNASYAEYFYGFFLSEQKQNNKVKRILTLIIRIMIPYLLQKLHEYSNNANQDRKKIVILWIYRGFKLIDILMKFQYLLNDEQKSYAIFYSLIKQDLIRFKMESPYKYGMLFIYLGLKFLDFYFSKKNNNVQQQNQIIQAPKQVDAKNVQKYCPKCKRIPQIPSVLKTTGYVYCLECLQQMVIKNEITNHHIIKLF